MEVTFCKWQRNIAAIRVHKSEGNSFLLIGTHFIHLYKEQWFNKSCGLCTTYSPKESNGSSLTIQFNIYFMFVNSVASV